MNIKIERHSSSSLIQQIYLAIKEQIQEGILTEDDLLPSIRGLAKQLEVSMVTVSKAYAQLEKEGTVKTVRGKGTFVLRHQKEKAGHHHNTEKKRFNWQTKLIDYLPSTRYFNTSGEVEKFSFDTARISQSLLAGAFPADEFRNIFRQYPTSPFSYGDIQGDEVFRNVAASFLQEKGIDAHPANLLVTNGVQQGIDLVSRTFLGQGDIVITETPTYSPAIEIFRSWGATVLSVPVDEQGMQVDFLENICVSANPKMIYINPTYQNPTGTVLSEERRQRLIEIAKKYQIMIIEDDSWSETYFKEPPPSSVKSLDETGHVIFLKGFSKWLSPGCRIAVLAAEGPIFSQLLSAKRIADMGSPLLNQKMTELLLQSEFLDQHTNVLREALFTRAELMLRVLKRKAPDGVTWTKPDGGLNVWITCPSWFNTDIFQLELQTKGLSFLPGSVCFSNETEYNHIRLSFSFMSEEQIEKGVIYFCQLLSEALTNHQVNHSPKF